MSSPRASQLPSPNGGDLLVQLMRSWGVDVAFGVISVHNLPLVDAVSRELRFVPVRHEAAAVNAADAYARVTGRVGIAITSTGTGAGNAAGAMVEALTAGSPVLHITGQIDADRMGMNAGFIHEVPDQIGMLTAVSKSAYTVYSPSTAAEVLQGSATEAMTFPRGPISIEWPIDLQYQASPISDRTYGIGVPEAPEGRLVQQAAEMIAAAKRPIIWAGGGATYARQATADLLRVTRAGLITSNSGRGTVDEGHAACIGNFAATAPVQELLDEADLVISIGTHFRSNETSDYKVRLPEAHIQIDIDTAALGRIYPCAVGVTGEAQNVVEKIVELLPERTGTDDAWLSRVAGVRRQVRQDMRDAIGWQAEICDAVRAAFPPQAVFARDVTIPSSTWGNRLFGLTRPQSNIFPKGGGIGQGLAMAIGAALGQPELPTLALAGDGGLAVHFGELLTLAQERPWLTLLVYNDHGYGVLRNTQDTYMEQRSGVDLTTADFELLAESLGVPHWRVSGTDEIEEALAGALSSQGPAIIEVDVDALGPMPKPFTPPVTIPVSSEGEAQK